MLTRLSHEGLEGELRRPWTEDHVDIFTAPDIETATKVATIIRIFGHATTEVWAATEWEKFTGLLRSLPPRLVTS
jgi:hypothetical protein